MNLMGVQNNFQSLIMDKMKSLIIIGASGVGKGTIIKNILSKYNSIFSLVLSFTTRKPRPYEKNGVDYFFVSPDQFEKNKNHMLQHKTVFKNQYGTSTLHYKQLLNNGKIPIMDIDVEGMLQINKKIDCEVLCILPPSWQLLKERLQGRITQSHTQIEQRMRQNRRQVNRMLKLRDVDNISYITNYEYPFTTYGVQLWMNHKFKVFRQLQEREHV